MHTKQYKSGRIYCLFPCEKEDTNPQLFDKKSNFNFIFMSSDVIVLARNGWKSQTQEIVHLSEEISCKKNNHDKLLVSKAMFFQVKMGFGKQFTC